MKAVWRGSTLVTVLTLMLCVAAIHSFAHQRSAASQQNSTQTENSQLQDAKALVNSGNFDAAIQKLTELAKRTPKAEGIEHELGRPSIAKEISFRRRVHLLKRWKKIRKIMRQSNYAA